MKKIALCCALVIIFSIQGSVRIVGTQAYGHVYCRNSANAGKIALTFDDGPHPRYTEEILNILAEYQIRATFFIIGVNAENYPEHLKMIVDSGCEIGNHTYSHARINKMDRSAIQQEIEQCERTVFRLTGYHPCLFRPPEGVMSDTLSEVIKEMQYNIVLWSIDTLDWAMNPSENICQTVTDQLKGGDIILMHDYVSGGNTTCQALKKMIPLLLAKGYEFVTVSELINGDDAKASSPLLIFAFIRQILILPFLLREHLYPLRQACFGMARSYIDQ